MIKSFGILIDLITENSKSEANRWLYTTVDVNQNVT